MNVSEVDNVVTGFMNRHGRLVSRLAIGVVFFWFGILKPMGISPAEPLILATVRWLPGLEGRQWVLMLGWWEVAIGVLFLSGRLLRPAMVLLAIQLACTLMPLVLLPSVTFQEGHFPYGLTMEGQYIVKNLLIISAAIVVGGSMNRPEPTPAD